MATFGYKSNVFNGLNSNSQIRRSVDMIYQRGATYEVILTGDTLFESMELDVDLYSDDTKVGRMQVVAYDIDYESSYFVYKFNVRPYEYFANFIESEHYAYYWKNDWSSTNTTINEDADYKNIIKANIKYGYRYIDNNGTVVTEYATSPTNSFTLYTDMNPIFSDTTLNVTGFTETTDDITLVGGTFQMDEKFLIPNIDQEIGSVITDDDLFTLDTNRKLSPMSQFLLDAPTAPEKSETSRFLTDSPRIIDIQSHENYVLYYLDGQTGDRQVIPAGWAVFEFFDNTNTQVTRYDLDLEMDFPTGHTYTLDMKRLPCGPSDIDNLFATIDWTQIAYYSVQIYSAFDSVSDDHVDFGPVAPVSESFYFYVKENCLPESTRLAFLNMRGGFDYYTFKAYRQDKKTIERSTFKSKYHSPSVTGPDRFAGRNVKTFNTEVEREITLETDFLTVEVGNWLEELFMSPQVYEMKDDYISPIDRQDKIYMDLKPIQVISSEVETITKKHKKLNKYRITIKYADSYFVQKGF